MLVLVQLLTHKQHLKKQNLSPWHHGRSSSANWPLSKVTVVPLCRSAEVTQEQTLLMIQAVALPDPLRIRKAAPRGCFVKGFVAKCHEVRKTLVTIYAGNSLSRNPSWDAERSTECCSCLNDASVTAVQSMSFTCWGHQVHGPLMHVRCPPSTEEVRERSEGAASDCWPSPAGQLHACRATLGQRRWTTILPSISGDSEG